MDYAWHHDPSEVDWDELSELLRLAPLSDTPPEQLKIAFSNSRFMCFVYFKNRLVGAGRALSDGIDCSYIADIAVHPDFQGRGLGKAIVSKLVDLSEGHRKIILYSNPGKEGFYKKLGFLRMKTAMAIYNDQQKAIASGLVSEE